jgi:hypothetical protein
MLSSIAFLFGFLAIVCTPGLIAQALEERAATSAAKE